MAKHKCVFCKEWIEPTEKEMPYKNRYVHIKCFDTYTKAVKDVKSTDKRDKAVKKRKDEKTERRLKSLETAKEGLSEEEYKDKTELFEYINKLLNNPDVLNARIFATVKNQVKYYGFTYKDIRRTLEYYYEIKENTIPESGAVVGIVPFVISEALRYYKELDEISKINKNKDIESFYKTKVVKINPRRKKGRKIDLESISLEEGGQ